MLNHKDKYIQFQLYRQSKEQSLYLAQKKKAPDEQVLINILSKAALVQPVDISSIINASHCLEMLEEDSENWYFITSYKEGTEVFPAATGSSSLQRDFNTQNFIQLMDLISAYQYLSPYYQIMLLKEVQFILYEGQLISREILDLSYLPEELPNFVAVRKQLLTLISYGIQQLKFNAPETYEPIDWQPLFNKSNALNSITAITELWTQEIQCISSRLKPEVLDNLYAIKNDKEPVKNKDSSLKNYNSLQPGSVPPKKKNLAIVLTCILAFLLIAASFAPNLTNYFNHLKNEQSSDQSKNSTKGTEQNGNGTTNETTQPSDTDNNASSGTEQLIPKNIEFLLGKWEYDPSQYHTGNVSLKLTLDKDHPSGTIQFNNLEISKNPSFSLWMRSDKGGNVNAIFMFYNGTHPLGTYKENINFESGEEWYLINPISSQLSEDLSDADTLKIQISGDINTLWIDDLQFESYK